MLNARRAGAISGLAVWLCVIGGAQADQAEMAFTLMFRDDLARVAQTEGLEDDAGLAQRFLAASENARLAEALRQRLREKAYSFGIKHPAGYDAALAAVDQMADHQPALTDRWDAMRLHVQELRHGGERDDADPDQLIDIYLADAAQALADRKPDDALVLYAKARDVAERKSDERLEEIDEAIEDARRAQEVERGIAEAEASLAENPGSRGASTQLARLLGIELDRPGEAVEAAPAADPALLEKLQLAAKPVIKLTEQQSLDLARWYEQQAKLPATGNREGALIRAKLYFSDVLFKHSVEDEHRLAVKFDIRRIDEQLAQLGVTRKVARKRVAKLAGGGRGHRDPAIDAAIDKGVAWLYEKMDSQDFWEKPGANTADRNYGGYSAIAVYALLMADEDPRTNRDLADAVRFVFGVELTGTYAVCFRMHAWELLLDRERYRSVMRRDAAWLTQAQTGEGFFDYTREPKTNPPRRDMSTTLAGALGFWLAQEVAGIDIPEPNWRRLASACVRAAQPDGGWSYKGEPDQISYGSMTCAGLTSLLVSAEHLEGAAKTDAEKAIADGLQWLDYQFTPDRNPIKGGWTYYYLAAVQHVGLLSGRVKFNDLEWYRSGAEFLVNAQGGDGSWGGVHQTAFAIAFLTRGGVHYLDPYAADAVRDEPEP